MRRATKLTLLFALVAAACADEAQRAGWGETITLAEADASNPTVAVAPDGGAVYVAWVGTTGGESNVWLARSTDGQTFEPAVRVNDTPGDAAPHEQAPAQVEAGPDGHVYVVWQNNTAAEGRRFPWSDVRFARSTDGGRTFEPAITVNDDADGPPASHTFHDIIVAPGGAVYVSWIDGRVRAALEAAADSAGSPAGEPAATDTTAATGHGMHGDDALPGPEIRVARLAEDGNGFGPSVVVAGDACPCCRTSLAAGRAGEVYVAWRTVLENDVRDVVLAWSGDGGTTWSGSERVHADEWVFNACPHAGPSVAVDDNGFVHIGWYTGHPDRPGLYYAASEDRGATFPTPVAVLTGEWVPPSQIKLAVDASGVIVAWDDRRGESPAVRLATVEAGQPGTPVTAGTGASPAVAAAGGLAAVAWLDGTAVRIRTRRTEAAPAAEASR